MGVASLTKIRMTGGRYEGLLQSDDMPPVIEAVHMERVVATADVAPAANKPGCFSVALDLPTAVLSDGVQVVSLRSAADGDVLDRITILAGEALDDDIRAEMALLRSELDMLKRAFRRHCAETGED